MKRLLYRCSPRELHKACDKLNEAQRKSVFEMGFGSVLENSVREIPTTIAYWCVSRYNPKNKSFDLPNGNTLVIEPEDVWLVLGFPKGELSMKRNINLVGNKLAKDWLRRLGKLRKRVTQRDVIDAMLGDDEGGEWFKLNFLIMLEFCLIEATSDGYERPKIMGCLNNLSAAHNMDWCQYLLDTLTLCHDSWMKNTDGFFNGPVLFLVIFYVDRIVNAAVKVKREFPVVKSWSTELLRQRQEVEIERGYFGYGKLAKRLNIDDGNAKKVCYGRSRRTHNEEGEANTEQDVVRDASSYRTEIIKSACAVTKKMNELVVKLLDIPQELAIDDQLLLTVESCNNLFNVRDANTSTFSSEFFAATQHDFDNPNWDAYGKQAFDLYNNVDKLKPSWREAANPVNESPPMHTFRSDHILAEENVTEIHTAKMEELLKVCTMGGSGGPSGGEPFDGPSNIIGKVLNELDKDSTASADDLEECNPEQDNTISSGGEHENTSDCGDHENTCDIVAEVVEGLDKTMEGPADTLQECIPDQESNIASERTTEAPPDSLAQLMRQRKGKMIALVDAPRTIVTRKTPQKTQSSKLSSPYALRVIPTATRLTKAEKEIYYWAISCKANSEDDIVYSDGFVSLSMFDVRTLAPHAHISVNLINGWSSHLNLLERYKSKESYNRFFYTCSACSYSVVKPKRDWDDAKIYEVFSERLDHEEKFMDTTTMKRTDLIFFPIYHAMHFYIICFNFKDKSILILDNSSSGDGKAITVKYAHVPHTLVKMFIAYLKKKGFDTKAQSMECVEISRVEMDWRDERNKNDCGVYTMRLMETFFGGPLKNWSIDFAQYPKKQIAYMRAKYCHALLLDKMNLYKEDVRKEAAKFFKEENKKKAVNVDNLLTRR